MEGDRDWEGEPIVILRVTFLNLSEFNFASLFP